MGLTWRKDPIPDDVAFKAMRTAVEQGAVHWSTADFYGPPENPTANIKLLRRYFDKYPQDAEKVKIYVKGGVDMSTFTVSASIETMRQNINNVKQILGDSKKIDYYGPSRVDKSIGVEEMGKNLKTIVQEGLVDGVFISEVGANTINTIHSIQPVSAIEVEFSLWTRDLLENGVAEAAKKNKIPILAYSPLGRGFLTGRIKTPSDIPEGDLRKGQDRFQEENIKKNNALAELIRQFAHDLAITPAQLALAWVLHQADIQTGPIIPIPGATTSERVEENTTPVKLTKEQFDELSEIVANFEVAGKRYNEHAQHMLWA